MKPKSYNPYQDGVVCGQIHEISIQKHWIGNNISPNDYAVDRGHNGNVKGFSMKSMSRMEAEYEDCVYDHPYWNNTKEKLMNILCNVLVNGDFNPKDKTNYLIP